MRANRIIFLVALILFVGLTGYALKRELDRNEAIIKNSISGVVDLAPGVGYGIVKTDNAHIFLLDPETMKPVAMNVLNPFTPPLTFHVGQEHAFRDQTLLAI